LKHFRAHAGVGVGVVVVLVLVGVGVGNMTILSPTFSLCETPLLLGVYVMFILRLVNVYLVFVQCLLGVGVGVGVVVVLILVGVGVGNMTILSPTFSLYETPLLLGVYEMFILCLVNVYLVIVQCLLGVGVGVDVVVLVLVGIGVGQEAPRNPF